MEAGLRMGCCLDGSQPSRGGDAAPRPSYTDAGHFDEVADRHPGALEAQGRDDLSVVTHPLRDLPAQAPWYERIGPCEPKVEQVVALLEAHVEDVAEPRGHQHAGLRAAPFDDRVGD